MVFKCSLPGINDSFYFYLKHVLRHFVDLYSLAAARVETLTRGRESLQVHFKPEAAVTPPAPAPAGKSAFQEIIITYISVPSQHLPSCWSASVGKCSNT